MLEASSKYFLFGTLPISLPTHWKDRTVHFFEREMSDGTKATASIATTRFEHGHDPKDELERIASQTLASSQNFAKLIAGPERMTVHNREAIVYRLHTQAPGLPPLEQEQWFIAMQSRLICVAVASSHTSDEVREELRRLVQSVAGAVGSWENSHAL